MGIDETAFQKEHETAHGPGPAVQRRRGRPQRLPNDTSPASSPTFDGVRRVAWLLATSRLLAPATRDLGRTAFLGRLREHGVTADASRLSRWEAGSVTSSPRLLAAYEASAEVASGSLLAADLMVRRATRQNLARGEIPTLDTDAHLDELFGRIDDGAATGGDWLQLATEITRYELIFLRAATWTSLCTRLVNELSRAGGLGFLRRYEAAALLMRHPTGRLHLTRRLGAFLMHPDVQNASPALALLSEVGDDAAGDLVVRLLGEHNTLLRRGAIGAVASMSAKDELPAGNDRTLERLIQVELRKGSLTRRVAALELVTQLPDAGYQRVVARALGERLRQQVQRARTTRELLPSDQAHHAAEGVASHAEQVMHRAAHEPDQMLRKLVRESLFHVQRSRRHVAASLLGASPYAPPVAQAVLRLTADRNEMVSSMSWSMLRRLSHVLDCSEVARGINERRDRPRARALVTLGLSCGPLPDNVADAALLTATTSTDPTLRHAATFALGMAGHPHLHAVANHDVDETARAGQWWLETGSALHDADAAPSVRVRAL